MEVAKVCVRNLHHWRRIYIERYSTDVLDADDKFITTVPSGGFDRFVADVAAAG